MHDKLGMGVKWERADRAFGGIEFLESTLCNAFPGVADLEVWKSIHAGPDFLELTLLGLKASYLQQALFPSSVALIHDPLCLFFAAGVASLPNMGALAATTVKQSGLQSKLKSALFHAALNL